MAFFIGLLVMYGLTWLVSLFAFQGVLGNPTMRGVVATAIMFTLVGISHFAKPEKLLAMIPHNWPYREAMNYISGAAEIILGLALLYAPLRPYAAWGLLALLVCVYPANIYVAMQKRDFYSISRLFFQPVYMAWIWLWCLR